MHYDDAKRELLRHAGTVEDGYEDGFVGCLRPYSGVKAENFHAVIESVLSVGVAFASTDTIERRIIEAVFQITVTSRRVGVDDGCTLVLNRLVSNEDRLQLRRWIDIIETMMLRLLAGQCPHESIHEYCEYVADFGWGKNAAFFVPLLRSAIEADDVDDRLGGYCSAIARLGTCGHALYESLVRARGRKWAWYEPQDQCAAESLGYIDAALAAIRKAQE